MVFRVDLEVFRGPMDLLLYLVRKHEVEITDIPIAPITEQFLAHLEVLKQLDINAVGDFLDLASHLMEIKSRMLLPHGGEEEEPLEDPRQELVKRLLEYKQYKDAASMLDERSRQWQQRFTRLGSDAPQRSHDPAEDAIQEVELWDLVSAFGRMVRDRQNNRPTNIIYDDTPIHVYMARIFERLQTQNRLPLTDLFEAGMHKSAMVGVFLALLELVRHYRVRAEQNVLFGQIWIILAPNVAGPLDLDNIDTYQHPAAEEGTGEG